MSAINFGTFGIIVGIAQPTDMICWARVATMIVSWKDPASYTVIDVMNKDWSATSRYV
jgi:hypothetical protein